MLSKFEGRQRYCRDMLSIRLWAYELADCRVNGGKTVLAVAVCCREWGFVRHLCRRLFRLAKSHIVLEASMNLTTVVTSCEPNQDAPRPEASESNNIFPAGCLHHLGGTQLLSRRMYKHSTYIHMATTKPLSSTWYIAYTVAMFPSQDTTFDGHDLSMTDFSFLLYASVASTDTKTMLHASISTLRQSSWLRQYLGAVFYIKPSYFQNATWNWKSQQYTTSNPKSYLLITCHHFKKHKCSSQSPQKPLKGSLTMNLNIRRQRSHRHFTLCPPFPLSSSPSRSIPSKGKAYTSHYIYHWF